MKKDNIQEKLILIIFLIFSRYRSSHWKEQ